MRLGPGWDGHASQCTQELAALTGKCQATMHRHMPLLRLLRTSLRHASDQGTIIVSVAPKPSNLPSNHEMPTLTPNSKIPDSKNLESRNLESPSSLLINQESLLILKKKIMNKLDLIELKRRGGRDSKFLESGIE
jgi:hypothetical protein